MRDYKPTQFRMMSLIAKHKKIFLILATLSLVWLVLLLGQGSVWADTCVSTNLPPGYCSNGNCPTHQDYPYECIAPNDCTRKIGPADSSLPNGNGQWNGTGATPWNQIGYHYIVRSFWTIGPGDAEPGSIVFSNLCTGDVSTGGAVPFGKLDQSGPNYNVGSSDLVDTTNTGPGGVAWASGSTTIRPVAVAFGVPNDGAPGSVHGPSTPCTGTVDPPTRRCNDGTSFGGGGPDSSAAFQDDGGEAFINGPSGTANELWCHDIALYPPGTPGSDDCPDGQTGLSTFRGAGWNFLALEGPYNWVRSPSWGYVPPNYNAIDLTNGIVPTSGGFLNNFTFDMRVENTGSSNMAAITYMTFKYPNFYNVENYRVAGAGPTYDAAGMPTGCGSMGMDGALTNVNPTATTTAGTHTFSDGDAVGAVIGCANGNHYALQGYTLCKNNTTCHNTTAITASNSVTIADDFTGANYDLWWHYLLEPAPTLTCTAGVVSNPSDNIAEPGHPFTIGMSFSQASGYSDPNTTYNYSATLTIAGINGIPSPAATGTFVGSGLGAGGTVSFGYTVPAANAPPPGLYIGTYAVTVSGTTGCSAPVTVQVATKPYLKVYGGDVMVGAGLPDILTEACSPDTHAGISTYGQFDPISNSDTGAGASTQFGAQAYSIITGHGFTSATGLLMAPPNPPTGLTFSNTVNGPPAADGGSFGSASCTSPFWAATTGQTFVGSGGKNLQSLGSGQKYYSPNPNQFQVNTSSVAAILVGTHLAVYIDGNAVIKNDVMYDTTSPRTNLDDIPSFYLIVHGNIYIDSSVTRLDGVYIATGTIYTCATPGGANWSPVPAAQLYSNCGGRLVVNGAFIAHQVNFLRTNGTLGGGTTAEAACTPSSNPCNIAETFNYSPEVWLANNGLPQTPGSPLYQPQSITSLPPTL